MNVTKRTHDIVSGVSDLETLFELKNFPVFQGCVDQPQSEDLIHDLKFAISRGTGMVQSTELLPLDIIYQSEHSPGAVGTLWMDHHRAFAKFIYEFNPSSVFEIGGSHGILSELYHNHNDAIDWTIIEPAPVDNPNLRAKLIKGFFDEDTELFQDMIVHSHVLEHIYNPSSFFKALASRPVGSKMCFSIPDLRTHIEQFYTNALSFEHTYFCTDEFVEYWLALSGYKILKKQHFKDHSVFYATERAHVTPKQIPNSYDKNRALFSKFWQHHTENIKQLNEQISKIHAPVFLFGAHIFSQFMLSAGLDKNRIQCILDNSPSKQNKRLYGTDLFVKSPLILKDLDCAVILRAGSYNDEIRNDILQNINSNVEFL